ILGREQVSLLDEAEAWEGEALNMTYLALRFSGYVNGVAMRHGEVSRGMFPAYDISAITNGVHAMTWTSPAFCELFDSYIPGWRADNNYLRYAISIPLPAGREAHADAKADVIRTVYVENYDMRWGKLITSGVDLWLNNPLRPQEASGTSGMKAALNGVPSFSVVDGWWAEGHIEGVTGWAIGSDEVAEDPS